MQFPFRDLTNQYISLSYQSVVQTYAQGTASYLLDGIGNVLGFIPTSSIGQQFITADQPVPFAITASFAMNGGGGGGSSISSSWASQSLSSSFATSASYIQITQISSSYASNSQHAAYADFSGTSSVSLIASFSDTSSYTFEAAFADTSSIASYANYAGSASYSITASYVLNVSSTASFANTSSMALTANSLVGFNFVNTGSLVSILNTDTPIIQTITGSYNAAFFDYVVLSGSNTRAGMVFGAWTNGLVNYTEVSNIDIGDTSKVTMSIALSGNVVQLVANVSDTIPWMVKALARYL